MAPKVLDADGTIETSRLRIFANIYHRGDHPTEFTLECQMPDEAGLGFEAVEFPIRAIVKVDKRSVIIAVSSSPSAPDCENALGEGEFFELRNCDGDLKLLRSYARIAEQPKKKDEEESSSSDGHVFVARSPGQFPPGAAFY